MRNLVFILVLLPWFVYGQRRPPEVGGLPVITVHTEGLLDTSKKKAKISVEESDTTMIFRSDCGIELHGNSTMLVPKKSYEIEFREGIEERTVAPLGFNPEEDFLLLANYYDRSFIRNAIAFRAWRLLGHYAPDFRFCRLYMNDEYRGLYMMIEKIKADTCRVDLNLEKRNFMRRKSLPYLIKLDWEGESITAQYEFLDDSKYYTIGHHPLKYNIISPKPTYNDWYRKEQVRRDIQKMMDGFRQIMEEETDVSKQLDYKEIIDLESFADYFLLTELTKNPDGFKTSVYMYRPTSYEDDSVESKISIGPVWDFDLAFANVHYANYNQPEGWCFQEFGPGSNVERLPNWWHFLVCDPEFISTCQERLTLLEERFSNPYREAMMDTLYYKLFAASEEDRHLWHDQATCATGDRPFFTSLAGEYETINQFYEERIAWIRENLNRIDCMHPDVAYYKSLNLPQAEADLKNQQFIIPFEKLGVEKVDLGGFDNYLVKNVKGEVIATGKTTGEVMISYKDWSPGEYFFEVSKWEIPVIDYQVPLLATSAPAGAGTVILPETSTVFLKPMVNLAVTSMVEPKVYYSTYSYPRLMASSLGFLEPESSRRVYRFLLVVPE